MLLLKIVGLFKTILIIIAVMVIIRFISRLMAAKRESDKLRKDQLNQDSFAKEKEHKEKNYGKTTILDSKNVSAQDVDYEEIN